MRMLVLGTALMLTLVPTPARADWLFTPSIGSTFGGDTNGNTHLTYGAALGWMGAGMVGWEADLSFTPEFFEAGDDDVDFLDSSNVITFMGNIIVGAPFGGQRDPGIRPYLTAGVGVLQTEASTAGDVFTVDNSEWGFNLGAGIFGFLSDHVGIRGDVRYLRAFEDPVEDNEFDIAVGNFDYWRGTAGLTFRW